MKWNRSWTEEKRGELKVGTDTWPEVMSPSAPLVTSHKNPEMWLRKNVEPAEWDKFLGSVWTLRQWENSVLNSNVTSGSLSCEWDVEKSLPLTSADTRLNLLTADKRGQNKRNPFLSEAPRRHVQFHPQRNCSTWLYLPLLELFSASTTAPRVLNSSLRNAHYTDRNEPPGGGVFRVHRTADSSFCRLCREPGAVASASREILQQRQKHSRLVSKSTRSGCRSRSSETSHQNSRRCRSNWIRAAIGANERNRNSKQVERSLKNKIPQDAGIAIIR